MKAGTAVEFTLTAWYFCFLTLN